MQRENRVPTKKAKRGGEDVNPQMERLLTVIGVIAAIIVVAVVVTIIARLGGVFRSGSGTDSTPAASVSQAEESLSSTQSRVPGLLGRTEEEAQADLEAQSLEIHYEYAASEDEEEGLVIAQSPEAGAIVSKMSEVTVTIGQGSGRIDLPGWGWRA